MPANDEQSRAGGSRSGGALAYWLAQGAVIPETFPKFRRVVFKAKKLIAAWIVSWELAADAEALGDRLTDVFGAVSRSNLIAGF